MPTLYLHTGVHRTATSSIQSFLRDNDNVLLRRGYLYPFATQRHAAQISQIVTGKISATDFAADLVRRIEKVPVPINSVILSDEDISSVADLGIFAGFQEIFEVKVITFMRRQDLWLESWYLQNIKWQWNSALAHLTFCEFFERRAAFFWIDYAARFAQIESIFGSRSVVPAVFEGQRMPQGPIHNFLTLLGIKDMSGFGPFVHRNSSLSPLMSEFMRHLPMDAMPNPERALVEAACIEVDKTLPNNGSRLLLNETQRLIVTNESAQGNRAVAQRYFGRDELFHEPFPAPQALLADPILPQESDILLEKFVGPVLLNLAKMLTRDRHAREKTAKGISKPEVQKLSNKFNEL